MGDWKRVDIDTLMTVLSYPSSRFFSRRDNLAHWLTIYFFSIIFEYPNLEIIELENSKRWFRVKLAEAQDDATSAQRRLLRQYHRGSQLYDVLHVSADHKCRGPLAVHEGGECHGKRVLLILVESNLGKGIKKLGN